MKMKIFEAIRNNSLEQVVACVEADPACVNAIAPKKPNDTKGMSPLQATLTTGWHRKIAWYLLEHGADVNFIEPPEIRKTAAHPAFFDAAAVAVYNARRYERNEDLLRIFAFLLEQGAEKSTFSSYARKTSTELYRGEPIWKLVGGLLEEDEGGGAEKGRHYGAAQRTGLTIRRGVPGGRPR